MMNLPGGRAGNDQAPVCELHGFLLRITRLWLGPNKKIELQEEQEVSNNNEFCIKNEECCIKNEEFCIKNEELCI